MSEIGSGGFTSINQLSKICSPFAKALANLLAALPNQFKSLIGTSYYADATYFSIAASEWEGQLTPIIHEKSVEGSRSIFRNSLRTVGAI
jgi:hypothetical protein